MIPAESAVPTTLRHSGPESNCPAAFTEYAMPSADSGRSDRIPRGSRQYPGPCFTIAGRSYQARVSPQQGGHTRPVFHHSRAVIPGPCFTTAGRSYQARVSPQQGGHTRPVFHHSRAVIPGPCFTTAGRSYQARVSPQQGGHTRPVFHHRRVVIPGPCFTTGSRAVIPADVRLITRQSRSSHNHNRTPETGGCWSNVKCEASAEQMWK